MSAYIICDSCERKHGIHSSEYITVMGNIFVGYTQLAISIDCASNLIPTSKMFCTDCFLSLLGLLKSEDQEAANNVLLCDM